jgi:predicted anti-sigma-YlaC factor YlaD
MKKENDSNCRQAQSFYYDYLTGQNTLTSAVWFEHIKQCQQCQNEIKRLENELGKKTEGCDKQPHILALHHQYLSQWIDCDAVKPFLASLVHPELSIRTETPVTVHIAQCPLCQKDLRTIASLRLSGSQLVEATRILSDEPYNAENLNEQAAATIQTVRNRKSSGTLTQMEVDTEGNPCIQVDTQHQIQTEPKNRLLRTSPLTRYAAAAAILLIASLVLFRTTTAGGISLQDVYQAVNLIANCRIQIDVPEQDEPLQTILISKEMGLVVCQQNDSAVLLDIQHHKAFYPKQKNSMVSKQFEQDIWSKINCVGFGLLPFETIRQLPAGYIWKRRPDLSQETACKIYDLTWKEFSGAGTVVEKTWRGYLLNGSYLPVRIQWIEKRPEQAEKAVMEMTIQYLDTREVTKELGKNPLYHLFKGDQVE